MSNVISAELHGHAVLTFVTHVLHVPPAILQYEAVSVVSVVSDCHWHSTLLLFTPRTPLS